MPILYRLGCLVVGLSVLCAGGWYIGSLRADLKDAREATRTAQAALKRTQATLTLREKQRVATARETASAQASLASASSKNTAWAEAPVPPEVQDALCAHLDCGARPDGLRHASNGSP